MMQVAGAHADDTSLHYARALCHNVSLPLCMGNSAGARLWSNSSETQQLNVELKRLAAGLRSSPFLDKRRITSALWVNRLVLQPDVPGLVLRWGLSRNGKLSERRGEQAL